MPKAPGSLVLPSPSATKRNCDSDRRVRGSWCLCRSCHPWTRFQVHRVMNSLRTYTEDLAWLVNNCFSVVTGAEPPRRTGTGPERSVSMSLPVGTHGVGAGRLFPCSFSGNVTGFYASAESPSKHRTWAHSGKLRLGGDHVHLAECQSNASCRNARKDCAPEPSPH